jgi:hypothetical protein
MIPTSLNAYDNGLYVAQLLWGLWLTSLEYLVIKARMALRIFDALFQVIGEMLLSQLTYREGLTSMACRNFRRQVQAA